jgi:hypothetical protein
MANGNGTIGKLEELAKTVNDFVLAQGYINCDLKKDAQAHEIFIEGNGKPGAKERLITIENDIRKLVDSDRRRQALVDTLTAGVALTLLLEIMRLVFGLH